MRFIINNKKKKQPSALSNYYRKHPMKSKEVLGGTSPRYDSTAVYCQKSEIRKAIPSPQAPKHHESNN